MPTASIVILSAAFAGRVVIVLGFRPSWRIAAPFPLPLVIVPSSAAKPV
jgi:hypothetical protein